MINTKKLLHNGLSGQGGIFDNAEGCMDVSAIFRDRLSTALSSCKESRWQICGKLSEMTRHNVSKDMLDKYTSSNRNYALRAEDLPAVIAITGEVDLARILLSPCGLSVIGPTESKLLALARMTEKKNRLSIEIAKLEHELLGK